MTEMNVTAQLKKFLSELPAWVNRPSENKKRRLGILLPALPDAPHAVKTAVDAGWIEPVLLGSTKEQELFCHFSGLKECTSITADDSIDALVTALEGNKIDLLLRGDGGVHTLFHRLLKLPSFRIGWVSQVAMVVPPKLNGRMLLLTDAGFSLQPTLEQKVRIIENVLKIARKLDFNPPKVALLAAVETVSPDITVGMHDAILAKMGERGQFGNALLEGPLALDLALSEEAAIKKKVKSPVAGFANVLIAPNLEVGNGLYKALITLAGAASASTVVGGSIPIALPSRADHPDAITASILLSCILS